MHTRECSEFVRRLDLGPGAMRLAALLTSKRIVNLENCHRKVPPIVVIPTLGGKQPIHTQNICCRSMARAAESLCGEGDASVFAPGEVSSAYRSYDEDTAEESARMGILGQFHTGLHTSDLHR
jgi:hypothetical protein